MPIKGLKLLMVLAAFMGMQGATNAFAGNYSWATIATEVESTPSFMPPDHTNSQVSWANTQLGVAGTVSFGGESWTNAVLMRMEGDGGKIIKLSTTDEGFFKLTVKAGNSSNTGGTVFETVSTRAKASAGRLHRFSLLERRGDGSSGQKIAAVAIVDGVETLAVDGGSTVYYTGPFRSLYLGGTAGNLVSGSCWRGANTVTSSSEALSSMALKVEADAAELYPTTSSVRWSNIEDATSPRATHFTKASGQSSLALSALPGLSAGKLVFLTSVSFFNASGKTVPDTITINGVTSATKTSMSYGPVATTAQNGTTYEFNTLFVFAFPAGTRPIVSVGETYPISSSGSHGMPGIKAASPISLLGLTDDWDGYNACCAVEGEAVFQPEAVVEAVAVAAGAGHAGGTVTASFTSIFTGSYRDSELEFVLRFDGIDADVAGERNDKTVSFTLPAATFPAGKVYRGSLVMIYPDGELPLSPVTVYGGEQTLLTESGWINETAATIGSTGSWSAGASLHRDLIEADADGGAIFTPVGSADYVAGCDSTFTVTLEADEPFAATDAAPDDDVQAAVRIAGARGAMKVQAYADNAWRDLCDARYGERYAVTVELGFAKSGTDAAADRVVYSCNGASVSGARRTASVAPVTRIAATDGTRILSLLGERELDKAIVVDVEIAPGETKGLFASDPVAAAAEAERMVVAIGEAVAAALPTDEAKSTYRSYLKVVAAAQADGSYQAQVVFTDAPELRQQIEADINEAVERVVANIRSDRAESVGRPGLYYGVLYGDEPHAVVTPGPKAMADASGRVEIVLPQPDASADRRFYRVICSPSAE